MKDKTIKRLRNKLWLFLTASFSLMMIFAFMIIYLSTLNSRSQEIQNHGRQISLQQEFRMSPPFGEFLLTFYDEDNSTSITTDLKITYAEFSQLLNAVENDNLAGQSRERFIWQVLVPLVYFDERTWTFTSWSDRHLGEQYFLFWDITPFINEMHELQSLLVKVGMVSLTLFTGIAYISANFLIRPSAKAFERQKQFIADASHELKTPLTIIKSNYSALMMNEDETVASQQRWLKNIEFGFERMSNLTNDLLVLAQLDNSENTLEKKVFDVSKTAESILHSLKVRVQEKDIKMTTQIEPEIMINQNIEKMTQVMVILLDNAIKYTEVGGWVEVELTKGRHQVSFTVKNSGPGIPPEKLPKIFERFYRGDESRNSETKSYGLGLAIAKSIIEQSGGKIHAESIENIETTFRFTLKI